MPDQPTILRLGPLSGLQWLGLAGVVLLVLLCSFLAYHRGQLSAGVDAAALALERREASTKAARLEAENARLNAKVAELEMARQLDREAYGQVEKTLGDLQSQLSRQGDDLAFYRSIVSPEDGVQGLRIHRFEVQPGATGGRVPAQADADPVDAARKRRRRPRPAGHPRHAGRAPGAPHGR